jgi:Anaphase promoting complex (APC) subunit 2
VFEPNIMGMLGHLDGMELGRIHNMLKRFATNPPYHRSEKQLAGFLARLVAEDKLSVECGVYRRRNRPAG